MSQYSNNVDIAKSIRIDCEKWKKGSWSIIVGERDKFRIWNKCDRILIGNIGLYKIAAQLIDKNHN